MKYSSKRSTRSIVVTLISLFLLSVATRAHALLLVNVGKKAICPLDDVTWTAATDCDEDYNVKGLKKVTVDSTTLWPASGSSPDGSLYQAGTAVHPSGGWTPGIHCVFATDMCGKSSRVMEGHFQVTSGAGNTSFFYDQPTGPVGSSLTFELQAVCTDTTPYTVLGTVTWAWTGPTSGPSGTGSASGSSGGGITVTANPSVDVGGASTPSPGTLIASITTPCDDCRNINWIQKITAATWPGQQPAPSLVNCPWAAAGFTYPLPYVDNKATNPNSSANEYYFDENNPPVVRCDCDQVEQ
jgi:hypothetical protein